MTSRRFQLDDSSIDDRTSRRNLLKALTALPVSAVAIPVTSPWNEAVEELHRDYGDKPVKIKRTKEGRALSCHRYHVAEEFLPERISTINADWQNYLYRAGIVSQLALSSHLLDVGFPDDWTARHIGLRVAKSLAYANATGFGHECTDMARLAGILTPYWKWNQVRLFGEPEPDDGQFTIGQVHHLLCTLLDRVHDITGHPSPIYRRRERREAWA